MPNDLLGSLRGENDDFYRDERRCVDFFYFLYFRTAKMRENFSNMPGYVTGHA
jgi:hypothetical protein